MARTPSAEALGYFHSVRFADDRRNDFGSKATDTAVVGKSVLLRRAAQRGISPTVREGSKTYSI
jgi:hypothetical protein